MSRPIEGTADDVRSLVPAASESWRYIRENVLERGVAPQHIKDLCYRHLASGREATDVSALPERERAALAWADAIAYDSALANDALWERLHTLFTEPELVDLGCAIGFELGQQHWRRTIGLPARED